MGLNSFGELNLNESLGKTVFRMFSVPDMAALKARTSLASRHKVWIVCSSAVMGTPFKEHSRSPVQEIFACPKAWSEPEVGRCLLNICWRNEWINDPNTRWHVSPLAFHLGNLDFMLGSLRNSFLIFLLGLSNALQQTGNRTRLTMNRRVLISFSLGVPRAELWLSHVALWLFWALLAEIPSVESLVCSRLLFRY